ncbi:hypothetical protein ANN_05060 [Periplaneta americana]|uniref:Uncharacterized protein n=1 Tax=Periplaneta americana TaxID=6978 RepID=A0ABQ8TBX7_PERAM|nr:hypothetical protein ANN_05060 [Periplaneta americana]
MFENKVLRKIFGAKGDEVTGEWRKLHNTELQALYSSPDIIRNIKSRRLRWAGHVDVWANLEMHKEYQLTDRPLEIEISETTAGSDLTNSAVPASSAAEETVNAHSESTTSVIPVPEVDARKIPVQRRKCQRSEVLTSIPIKNVEREVTYGKEQKQKKSKSSVPVKRRLVQICRPTGSMTNRNERKLKGNCFSTQQIFYISSEEKFNWEKKICDRKISKSCGKCGYVIVNKTGIHQILFKLQYAYCVPAADRMNVDIGERNYGHTGRKVGGNGGDHYFRQSSPDSPGPSEAMIYNLVKKFRTTGSVLDKKRTCVKRVLTEEMLD